MLILTRKPGESLYIGDKIKVTIVESKGNQIRIGIDAPRDTKIYREEIYLQIVQENQQAATSSGGLQDAEKGLSGDWSSRPNAASQTKPRSLGVDVLKRRTKKKTDDV